MRLRSKTRAMFKGRLFEIQEVDDFIRVIIRSKSFGLLNSSWNFYMPIEHRDIFENLDIVYYTNKVTNVVEPTPYYVQSETLWVEYSYPIKVSKKARFVSLCVVTINGIETIINKDSVMTFNIKYFK